MVLEQFPELVGKVATHHFTNIFNWSKRLYQKVKIDVFPNPCVDLDTVRFSQVSEPGSHIEIIDITGRKVASREIENSSESFSLGQFPSGW